MTESTLNGLLLEALLTGGQKPAVREWKKNRELTLSFSSFYERVCALSERILEEGWQKKRIGILGDNSSSWLILFFAALFTGNAAVLLDQSARGDFLRDEASRAGCELYFCSESYRPILTEAVGEEMLYCLEQPFGEADPSAGQKEPQNLESLPVGQEDPAVILFSSGTTGRSKAILLDRRHLLNRLILVRDAFSYPSPNLLALPFCHCYGLHVFMGTLLQGKCLSICSSQKYFWRDIQREDPQMLSLVPSQAEYLLDLMEKGQASLSLKELMLASSRVSESLKRRMERAGIRHIAHYGSSEAGFISVGPEEVIRPGFAGKLVRGYEIECRDPGKAGGEIFVRSSGRFCGYLGDEEATRQVLMDDWICTGDLGCLDDQGCLYISGRVKNVLILPNGEKISPEMLEEKLLKNPDVLECRVREEDGKITAEIYAGEKEAGAALDGSVGQTVSEINQNLSLYRQIQRISFRDSPFEKTALGKIKR